MRRLACLSTVLILAFMVAGVPALAEDTGFSVGLGVSGGQVSPDGGFDLDTKGYTLFGRWQHDSKGWGAMAEIRDGKDDENLVDFDYMQVNLYGTYTWLRDGLARPFVKAGLSKSDVDFPLGLNDDDTALILGGGVEVGRGRWAFHASLDVTQPKLGAVDVDITNLTLAAVLRF